MEMENNDVHIKLTTTEIATLWRTYIQNTSVICFYRYFLQYLQDEEIRSIIREAVVLIETIIGKVETIFEKENFPIPEGFSDKDIDLSAPALYTDILALSFLYRGGQVIIPQYANTLQHGQP